MLTDNTRPTGPAAVLALGGVALLSRGDDDNTPADIAPAPHHRSGASETATDLARASVAAKATCTCAASGVAHWAYPPVSSAIDPSERMCSRASQTPRWFAHSLASMNADASPGGVLVKLDRPCAPAVTMM